MLRLAVAFPAAFACRRLCCVGRDGSLVDDLNTWTPVVSALPAAAAEQKDGKQILFKIKIF